MNTRDSIKKQIDEIAQSHTNANLYDVAVDALEKVQKAHDSDELDDIIKHLKSMRDFEINYNCDVFTEMLISDVVPKGLEQTEGF